ncbi:hypothetical protein JOF53_006595 [Crossiella equi]|uniref:Restriction endonuclease n=1 Tax=Crossiella equi TaxID=130796 RepID=A0ABS5AME3_9PSEU|nr:hypothetical protein [Crossiella equi]MBP2477723.1 hypothetical protein [Crossiella equi]
MLGHDATSSLHANLVAGLAGLTENQLQMVSSVVRALHTPVEFLAEPASDLVDSRFAEIVSNFLVLHHSLHEEAFSKRPFEYLLKQCLIAQGHSAELNPTPGESSYDVHGGDYRWSLKTEAAQGISTKQVKIEKFMEARWVRDCPSNVECAAGVRERIPAHMNGYDRILILRAFTRPDSTIYKLEEIPKQLLIDCFSNATPEMFEKKASAKGKKAALSFGADFFHQGRSSKAFRILLDSSVEKIRLWYQVEHCVHHGTWVVPRSSTESLQLYTKVN